MRLRIEPLGENHDRAAFSCGQRSIDDFLKKSARQRQQRRIGTTMVAVDAQGDGRRIVGFYTLLPHEFRGEELPDPYRRGSRIGNLSAVPGALLAQLGVDVKFQGRGIAKALLAHALKRVATLAEGFGCVAVIADPVDPRARDFYAGIDFQSLPGSERMILPVKTLVAALSARNLDA